MVGVIAGRATFGPKFKGGVRPADCLFLIEKTQSRAA
jgi:hypothetical protein